MPYLRTLSSFRDGVRALAMTKGDDALKNILALCDSLRDTDLVPLGVALDDQPGMEHSHFHSILRITLTRSVSSPADGKALVKFMSPTDLIKARDEKRALAESKAAKKTAAAEAERFKRQQRLNKGRLAAEEMFKPPNVPEGSYSKWDEAGLPVMDGEGKELSKSGTKKLAKEWAVQKKLHDEFLVWQKETQ
jgi:cysteinyl-tRNA synthetase